MTARDVTDDDLLTGYLDGELSPEQMAQMAARLDREAGLRARRDMLAAGTAGLDKAGADLLSNAPDMPPLTRAAAAAAGRPARLALAATLVLGLGLGALGTSLIQASAPSELSDWRDFAAAYHALYTTDTLAGGAVTPDMAAAQLARLSERVGLDLSGSADLPGLEFRRAQMLQHDGAALVQIAYLAPGGVPVALCVMAGGTETEQVNARRQGLPSVSWSRDGHRFLLLGQGGGPDLSVLAREVATRL